MTLVADNAGPWDQGGRSTAGYLYNCPPGGSTGNGEFDWALTGAGGSFPSWSGPLCELTCLSKETDAVQTWTFEVSGWNYCVGPTYFATAVKKASDDKIIFNIGSGTITLYFETAAENYLS